MLSALAFVIASVSSCDTNELLTATLMGADVSGVILVQEAGGTCHTSAPGRMDTPYPPASTFKIPNTIIGLEAGVLSGADHRYTWDGVERSIRTWNQDHTLRSAYRHSAVWYYQVVARRVGMEAMSSWVRTLDYGNQKVGPAIDTFWLDGDLRISARQQLQFLQRLAARDYPLKEQTYDTLDTVMRYPTSLPGIVSAKTGWAVEPDPDIGWFVGWWDYDGHRRFFVLNIDMEDGVSAEMRIKLVESALLALTR